jgi:hypothetical protein
MALALLRGRGMERLVGVLGVATGAVPPVAILATWPAMDTAIIVGILGAQAVWNAAAGSLLLRRPASGRHAPAPQEYPQVA